MMTVQWRNVRLILLRELRDQLRDRRTLFMVAVLPLLLYPALGIGMLQLTMLFTEQPRTVVILGAEHLAQPPLLKDGSFDPRWFKTAETTAKLRVVTDLREASRSTPEAVEEQPQQTQTELLRKAQAIRKKLAERQQLTSKLTKTIDPVEMAAFTQQSNSISEQLTELFSTSGMQVLLIIPDDFGKHVLQVNQQLAERQPTELLDYERPIVVHNNADEKSLVAFSRVREALNAWEAEILAVRLKLAKLPSNLPDPVKPISEDLASKTQLQAVMWSKLFPALLIIMSITGAFYPAIDLCAGEKERGTMETLLICPARRTEIVLGKFFTVMCFSVATAVLNLISMGMTGKHMASMMRGPMATGAAMEFPPLHALIWIIVLLLPLAAMFSALCLSLATFARSSKEGQYYLTPLLMVTLGLTVFCLSPGIELSGFYSVMPIVGVALLLKGLLLNPQDTLLYWYAIPVLVTSVGYSLISLWWAIDQFQREEVLFREAERFELRLWLRHLFRDKEPTPTFTEGAFCFLIIMFVQFAAFQTLSQASLGADGKIDTIRAMRVLLVQQVAIIAMPALLMGMILTSAPRRTLRINLPSLKVLGIAIVLALACHPLSLALVGAIKEFFPKLDDSINHVMQEMGSSNQPVWLTLLVFAVAPGICEEIAFRGFILSGFGHSGRRGLAIVLSSLAFGLMHMIPQQIFNAALLGMVLGLIAYRGNSLFPCIAFHICYNGLAVMHGRWGQHLVEQNPQGIARGWLYVLSPTAGIHYTGLTLVLAGGVFLAAMAWLIRGLTAAEHLTTREPVSVLPSPARAS